MRILYFDTETNGLPKVRGGSDTDIHNHPIIVQIAWQIWDDSQCVKRRSILVKPPPDIVWNMVSAGIHKIYKSFALQNGIPVEEMLSEFQTDASSCQVLVAHNMAFDLPILKCSYLRVNPATDFDWLPALKVCTMKETTALCRLPFINSPYPARPGNYKQPRLAELHTYLFGNEGNYTAHNASDDVESLVKCAQELLHRNIIRFTP